MARDVDVIDNILGNIGFSFKKVVDKVKDIIVVNELAGRVDITPLENALEKTGSAAIARIQNIVHTPEVKAAYAAKLEAEKAAQPKKQKTVPVEVQQPKVEVIDGKAVVTMETVTINQPVFEELPMVGADGKPVMIKIKEAVLNEADEEIEPAVLEQARFKVPVME